MRSTFRLLLLSSLVATGASAQVTGLQGWNIFLDPGHSARENMGIYNYSEAEKNLRVALALRDMLLTQTDIDTVYLSRTNDLQIVGLTQRSDLANALGADWFHSIHSDASSSTAPNSTLLLWGQLRNGAEKTPPGGARMSDFMVDVLTRGMRTTTRGSIGDCSFYGCSGTGPYLSVNRNTVMPSELSEAGFHTNPTQNQRNMNAEWKRLEARTFLWAILDFWGIPRPPVDIVTGYVTDSETGLPINGATVSIVDQEYTTDTYESLFRFYSSNPDLLRNGFYYIEDVGPNPLPVTVSAEGYHTSFFDFVQPTDTFFTFFDVQLVSSTPPRVVSSDPAEGEGAFRIVNPIVIDFSRPMDRTSVESAFALDPPATGRLLWSNNDFRLTFRPDSLPPLTPMTLTIAGSALGALGDPFDGNGDGTGGDDFVVSFTTGPADTQAPGIADTYPSIRANGVELDPIISIVMNEVLDGSSVATDQVEMVTASGDPVAGVLDHHVVGERSVLSFFPALPLQPLEAYIVRVQPGLRDLVGNVRSTQQQFNFSTGEIAVERTIIDDFETDVEVNWWPPEQSGSTTGIMPGVTARTTETQVVHLGTGSSAALRVTVEWEEGASTTLLREYLSGGAPKDVVFDSTYAIEAYVFGDGSGTLFRFAVDDRLPLTAAEYHEVSPWFVVDWYGWRLVSWRPGRDGTGVWLGDGVLDGNLRIDSIQLSRSESGGNSASVVVDDLSLARRGVATGVESSDELPDEFEFMQNYPNPFRDLTTLQFKLPEPGPLTVSVYNVLGAEVARLADQYMAAAGTTELSWNASDLPSGVYIARARFGRLSRSIQMVLVK